MTNPSGKSDPDINRVDELGRIYASALLACVMIVLSVLLDGPVSILSWLLLISGFLCLTYVVVAARKLLIYFRSLDQNAETHE
jgi:hypothetical protein